MTDKKIVDDYYSNVWNDSNQEASHEKKKKVIVWKIKVKKQLETEKKPLINSWNSEDNQKEVKKEYKTWQSKEKSFKTDKKIEKTYTKQNDKKDSGFNAEKIKSEEPGLTWSYNKDKSGYTTWKKLQQQKDNQDRPQREKRDFVPREKKEFVQREPRKDFVKKDFVPKDWQKFENKDSKPSFNRVPKLDTEFNTDDSPKKGGYKTWKWDIGDLPVRSERVFDNKKKKTKEELEKTQSKFFKKDKSGKHFKNTFMSEEEDISFVRSNKIKTKKKEEKNVEDIKQDLTTRTWETVILWDILSVKEFSEKIWVPIVKLIAEFMKNWMMVTLNSKIDFETLSIISESFWVNIKRDMSAWYKVEDLLEWNIADFLKEDDTSVLVERSPVISIMWHVDHWKTSLLDRIRKSKVADKEAWGITQSIWAYQVEYNGKNITFLDTPWHEAFTVMRARWAKSTDIAILVVAADEWVKPQTIESINHAREAWIPIIVAINKMDKEWANPDNVKSQLSQNWLLAEDWGWDIPMIPVSAKAWLWIDDLLEIIVLQAEILELKANPNRAAVWTVLESHLDSQIGPVASILINTWTLNKWDCVVCKWSYWRVKILKDFTFKNISEAEPSTPVLVIWFDSVVSGWDIVQVVSDIEKARVKALEYKELMSSKKSVQSSSIDLIMSKIKSGSMKQLKVILKADTNWSLEALKSSLTKLSTAETKVQIIHAWVWSITQWDVLMSQWSNAILVWFNVELIWNTRQMIDDTKVEYISSKVIYHITERVEKIVTWMLDPKEIEVSLWEAKVWGIFYVWKWFTIIWLKLAEWSNIENKTKLRVVRNWKVIWKWEVDNLKSWILDVVSLEWPIECWIKFVWDVAIEMKDTLEIFKVEIQK